MPGMVGPMHGEKKDFQCFAGKVYLSIFQKLIFLLRSLFNGVKLGVGITHHWHLITPTSIESFDYSTHPVRSLHELHCFVGDVIK